MRLLASTGPIQDSIGHVPGELAEGDRAAPGGDPAGVERSEDPLGERALAADPLAQLRQVPSELGRDDLIGPQPPPIQVLK